MDQVAYVRFASVYRSFKDIDEFMHELEDLIRLRKEAAPAPPVPVREKKGEHASRRGEPAS
jgi:transcriptional repressor NrdR